MQSHTGTGSAQAPVPFQISSVACKDGCTHVARSYRNHLGIGVKQRYALSYRIFRPNAISSQEYPPLVVIHGGMGLPSDYLLPLVDNIPYRCVIMYDQLGCGRSESPNDINAYSIGDSVNDLKTLLDSLRVTKYHLYAHSAGTCIAFEYLKLIHLPVHAEKQQRHCCLSAIFSSGSFNIQLAKQLADDMEAKVTNQLMVEYGKVDPAQLAERIRTTCICRTPSMPVQLKAAYSKAGTVWKGLEVIQDYVAECLLDSSTDTDSTDNSILLPPMMLLRGEYDFISEELAFQGWRNVLCAHAQDLKCSTMEGCSHMPMLEDPSNHGRIVNAFYNQCD